MQRLKHEHIHRVGYIRYHFAPIVRWFSKRLKHAFGRNTSENKVSLSSKLPNSNYLEGKNDDGVGKLAREFSLSPVKQVIRSVYNNGMERVVEDKDGGTPKIVKWSGEGYDQSEFKHLEKDIETDRSNGLHRSGHWNPQQLDRLNAYSNTKQNDSTSQLDNAKLEHPECSSSSSSDEGDDNEDEHHLAPPPSLYTNPDPITNTYLPEVVENPQSKFSAYKKLMRKDSNRRDKHHPRKGRLYNKLVVNRSGLSADGGFVYTSGEDNPAITIYEPENIR